MGDGDLAARAIHRQRLGIAQMRRAGGRIARVADGHVARPTLQDFAIEILASTSPMPLWRVKLLPVGRDDAGAFLAAMLQA